MTVPETETDVQLLTVAEVAARMSVSRAWVLQRIGIWEKDKTDPRGLPAINVSSYSGRGARWRVELGVLAKWLESLTT